MSDVLAAIVLAAGSSSRMGGEDKLWADLDGTPVIGHALRGMTGVNGLDVLVIVCPEDRHAAFSALLPERPDLDVRCVEGGERRQDSVAAGIAITPEADWYLVHDGARPLVTAELAASVLAAARVDGAAVPGLAIADTLKRVGISEGSIERVVETVDRSSLRAVQTPQAFAGDLLREAHATVHDGVTDDASMVEALGRPVAIVEGDPANLKVTRPADLLIARAFLKARETLDLGVSARGEGER